MMTLTTDPIADDVVTTLRIQCDLISKFCRLCNRKFGIRNASCCPICSKWRQLCQACNDLEQCLIVRRMSSDGRILIV